MLLCHAGSPKLLSLQIVGDAVEGNLLSVDKRYWGGEEGDSIFRWFRVLLINKMLLTFFHSQQIIISIFFA